MGVDILQRLLDLKDVYGTTKALSESLNVSTSTIRRWLSGAKVRSPYRRKINRRYRYFSNDDRFLYQWEATCTRRVEVRRGNKTLMVKGKRFKQYSQAFDLYSKDYFKDQFRESLDQSARVFSVVRMRLVRREIQANMKSKVKQVKLR